MASETASDARWRSLYEVLAYMNDSAREAEAKAATDLERARLSGWHAAIGQAWFQAELQSRAAGFPESDTLIGPIVSKACGFTKEGRKGGTDGH